MERFYQASLVAVVGLTVYAVWPRDDVRDTRPTQVVRLTATPSPSPTPATTASAGSSPSHKLEVFRPGLGFQFVDGFLYRDGVMLFGTESEGLDWVSDDEVLVGGRPFTVIDGEPYSEGAGVPWHDRGLASLRGMTLPVEPGTCLEVVALEEMQITLAGDLGTSVVDLAAVARGCTLALGEATMAGFPARRFLVRVP